MGTSLATTTRHSEAEKVSCTLFPMSAVTVILAIDPDDTESQQVAWRWLSERRRCGHLVTTASVKNQLLPLVKQTTERAEDDEDDRTDRGRCIA
jgi:hypothetical protein